MMPFYLAEQERAQAAKHPLYLAKSDKVVTVSHHLAHAYSAFAACPFDEGVVMVVDGVGSYSADITGDVPARATASSPLARESESYYRFQGLQARAAEEGLAGAEPRFPERRILQHARARRDVQPGVDLRVRRLEQVRRADGPGALRSRRANQAAAASSRTASSKVPDWPAEFNQPWLIEDSSELNWEESPSMPHWEDLAWRIQDDTERVLLARASWLRETTGAKNLCIAGGVALNCVANGRIAREAGFENVWIQPAAGDDGIAIGCAYYGHLAIQKKPRSFVMNHAYLGRPYNAGRGRERHEQAAGSSGSTDSTPSQNICARYREGAVRRQRGRLVSGPLRVRPARARQPQHPGRPAHGRDEGHPEQARQAPAGVPAVRADRAVRAGEEIFEGDEDSPYMLIAKRVRPEWHDKIPAIVHVDGTARVQTVREETNKQLYRLLKEFEAITGVPVLLNTSFNVKGEPIVETPDDAMECFLTTGIDYLALSNVLMAKGPLHKVLSPVIGVFADVRSIVQMSVSAT